MGLPPSIASIGVRKEALPFSLPWWTLCSVILAMPAVVGLLLLPFWRRKTRDVAVSRYKPLPPSKEPILASPSKKVPPAPPPPQPKSPPRGRDRSGTGATGVHIEFSDLAGNTKTVVAEYRPMGVILDDRLQVTDWTFNSHARHLGV